MKKIIVYGFVALFVLLNTSGYSQTYYDNPYVPIDVKVGRKFIICLESNPTTGYKWEIAKPLDNSIVKFVYSSYKPGRRKLLGGAGRELWVFKAVGRGKTEIWFKYVRPWEKGIPPIDKKIFKVIVG